MMTKEQASLVWKRLTGEGVLWTGGRSLNDLDLDLKDGRLDLRRLFLPDPSVVKCGSAKISVPDALDKRCKIVKHVDLSTVSEVRNIENATWEGLDFTGSRLRHLKFFNCVIRDCVFDECGCEHWGFWNVRVENTSFQNANLRGSALGAVYKGRRNSFNKVNFAFADMRETSYSSTEITDCKFKDTKLTKVDFEGSSFSNCSFEGELREVCFNRFGFRAEQFPPNEMSKVDFSRAKLSFVEFRKLDLDDVIFPIDRDHLVVENYPLVLDRVLQGLQNQTDGGSKKIRGYFKFEKQWLGAKQVRGVIKKHDLLEMGGNDGLRRVLEIIEGCRG